MVGGSEFSLAKRLASRGALWHGRASQPWAGSQQQLLAAAVVLPPVSLVSVLAL